MEGTPRSGPIPLASPVKSPRSTRHAPHRSASFPAENTDGEEEDKLFDGASLASSRRPLLTNRTPGSTIRSNASKGRPGSHRLRTDPLPLSSLFSPPGAEDIAEADESMPAGAMSPDSLRAQKSVVDSERVSRFGGVVSALPRAVVVSGLEHTTAPSQRALMRVLTEKKIVFDSYETDDTDFSGKDTDVEDGTWNLPDGFLMVYVCKADPHERPAILRGLIDKFSMSADISLPLSVRQSYLAYRAAYTPTPRGTPVASSQALPHLVHSYFAAPVPVHPSPARRSVPLPAATPQTPPVLPTTELSHLRSLARPYPLAAPIFYPSVNATEGYPWTAGYPSEPPPHAALHPSLEHYLLDLFAATRHHPALDGTLLTARAHADAEALARAFRVLGGDTVGATLVEHEARLEREREREEGSGPDGLDARSSLSDSAAWRSAESVLGNGNGHGNGDGSDRYGGPGFGMSKGQGKGKGVRVHVEEDGEPWSPTPHDALLAQAAEPVAAPEVSPAEAQAEAMRRSWPEVWDVSEEDVARIFPRVVSHRLRARNGPDDELLGSVMFPAVPPKTGGAATEVGEGMRLGWERKSVKEILVRILADV
ncbi:hypothetical protein LXA43DRAFT_881607 [Ganoderma leucocontextum]|nr:hypothetical protein LXA43DRAFT_881607 [Ganoderma leucocontextum]